LFVPPTKVSKGFIRPMIGERNGAMPPASASRLVFSA
jgi:hypothetical protein